MAGHGRLWQAMAGNGKLSPAMAGHGRGVAGPVYSLLSCWPRSGHFLILTVIVVAAEWPIPYFHLHRGGRCGLGETLYNPAAACPKQANTCRVRWLS